MFDAPLHPKIVHLPIALAVLMPLMSVGLLVAWWREWLPARTWWIAIALQGVLFGASWVAMETGETDEEKVEEVVEESAIHTHEERAEQFFWASGGVLALMVLPMVIPGRSRRRWLAVGAAAGTVVVFWLGARVGEAGGALVYEHGAGQVHSQSQETGGGGGGASPEAEEDEEHEE
jgi:uncharacterized membrane protein